MMRNLRTALLAGTSAAALVLIAACGGGEAGPSQPIGEASRDGVLPALAALSFEDRVDVQAAIPSSEGVWVISRPGPGADEAADGCRLGIEEGRYPTEMICTLEYGELLLLDESREHVLRAFPLPAVPPDYLAITDDAVYCGRHGAGGLPDSMLCRVDRQTFDMVVRIFPSQEESIVVQPCFYPPSGWVIEAGYLEVADFSIEGSALRTADTAGVWREIDGRTLEVVSAAGAAARG